MEQDVDVDRTGFSFVVWEKWKRIEKRVGYADRERRRPALAAGAWQGPAPPDLARSSRLAESMSAKARGLGAH
jgi:hypothetical protein